MIEKKVLERVLKIIVLTGVSFVSLASRAEPKPEAVQDRAYALNSRLKNPPKLDDAKSFSMVIMGDPQSYTKFDFNQPIFELMTSWIAAQKDNLNIKTVLCTGDLVEQNEIVDFFGGTRPGNGNQPSSMQWKYVSRAFERLDNLFPYIAATGNHDFGIEASENRRSDFGKIFDISRNATQWRKHLLCTAPNAFGVHTLENAAFEFNEPNWGKIIIIVLEFSPRDETIDWAKKLCERHIDSKVFVLTHSILEKDGKVREKDKYKAAKNTGKDLCDKLLIKCPNIKFAICGHTGSPKIMSAFNKIEKENGQKLPIMMFNPQFIPIWNGNGGDGWIRILEFKPDGKTISVKTYSPLFGASPRTEELAWEKSPANQFEFQLN